jgi:hypothetical protein
LGGKWGGVVGFFDWKGMYEKELDFVSCVGDDYRERRGEEEGGLGIDFFMVLS